MYTGESLLARVTRYASTITVACILDCVWPELLRARVVDVAEHSNVGFGYNVSYSPLSDTMSMFVTCG